MKNNNVNIRKKKLNAKIRIQPFVLDGFLKCQMSVIWHEIYRTGSPDGKLTGCLIFGPWIPGYVKHEPHNITNKQINKTISSCPKGIKKNSVE